MNVQKTEKQGFTIIEVVLVLAIAGLIFLMIFIAWPALQRSQRDSARKNDVNAVASAISTYRGNHRGTNPPDSDSIQQYISNMAQYSKDAEGKWPIKLITEAPAEKDINTVFFITTAKCKDTGDAVDIGVDAGATTRQAAVLFYTEASGNSFICQDA